MLRSKINRITETVVLYMLGGTSYVILELLWRGRSHSSMFMLGGLCFLMIGMINEEFSWEMPLWKQQLISTGVVTLFEFICGLIVNVWLGMNVWDYSNLPFNLMGQICLQFSILWFFLALPVIVIDDIIRWKIFGEERPRYKIW